MNIIWLLFAHFIGDIALQSDWQAQNKGTKWYVMLSHCMIWTACICVALHWACDKWKTTKPRTPEAWVYIYPDQAWHFIQCVIVYWF
jgi:hypothetical protein